MGSEMKALILYHTETGNTEKAAHAIQKGLERENIHPVVQKISEAPFTGLQDYDLIFIGSGVGHWIPPTAMQDWTWDALDYCKPEGYELGMQLPKKNGVVFITHSGPHTGINEAIPASKYLGCFLEHIGFAVRAEWYLLSEFIGIRFPPCQDACPINQDVPWYIAHMANGQLEDAITVIRKKNPLPSICGRVCTHPCEENCEAGKTGRPIAIRALKRFAADYESKIGEDTVSRYTVTNDEKVAVIGSGPAGMTAAHYLSMMGYPVTVFEALPVAGGMLAMGIPGYRLPRGILEKDIHILKKAGLEIRLNTRIGEDMSIQDLQRDGYKAIVVAIGCHESKLLGISGEGLEGVIHGLSFLSEINSGRKVPIGDQVVVIGGGNVAIDSARSALRLGAREVRVVCLEDEGCMLAHSDEVNSAKEEGISILNSIHCARIMGENDHVCGVECVKVSSFEFDETGKPEVCCIDGSGHTLNVDTVIIAAGQQPNLGLVDRVGGIKVTRQRTLEADPITFVTGTEGIFAAGDVVTGPRTIIDAMATGKEVAKSIDCYLRCKPYKKEEKTFDPALHVKRVHIGKVERAKLWPEIQRYPAEASINNFNEIEAGFTPRMATMEALRCVKCDLQSIRHEELRRTGELGDTTGRPNDNDLAELENKTASFIRWIIRETQFIKNSS